MAAYLIQLKEILYVGMLDKIFIEPHSVVVVCKYLFHFLGCNVYNTENVSSVFYEIKCFIKVSNLLVINMQNDFGHIYKRTLMAKIDIYDIYKSI
jgi:hypothetical protein